MESGICFNICTFYLYVICLWGLCETYEKPLCDFKKNNIYIYYPVFFTYLSEDGNEVNKI